MATLEETQLKRDSLGVAMSCWDRHGTWPHLALVMMTKPGYNTQMREEPEPIKNPATDATPIAETGTPPPQSLFDLTRDSLQQRLADLRIPSYRAGQILQWLYVHRVTTYEEMSNLPKSLREQLAADLTVYQSTVARRVESKDGTIKLLLRWPDDTTSEAVLIPDADRTTACISTQVGCPVGCGFCASGLGGLQRQLSAGQIVEQAMRLRELCGDERLTNLVMMGIGEPLANYDATIQAVRTINAEWGLNIGARKITVSTVGLPKAIRKLADEGLQITLALSLHAPNDELRSRLIPWAQGVTIDSLVDACRYYFERTGREVTLEYVLLGGTNDSQEQALQLAGIAKRMRSNVNLIVYNPVEGLPFRRPGDQDVTRFLATLRSNGANAHTRRSRGLDIDAACGQLRLADRQA